MGRFFSIILLSSFVLSGMAQKPVRISVDIKGVEKNDTLALQWGASNKSTNPLIAQMGALEGTEFTVPLNEPRLICLNLKGTTCNYELLASPGDDIHIEGRIRKIETSLKTNYQFRKMKVTGARWQDKYTGIINSYQAHVDSLDGKVYSEYKDVAKLIDKAKENNDEQTIANMYQTLHGQSYIDRVMNTYEEREIYTTQLVSRYRDDFFGPLLLLKLKGRLDKSEKPLYDQMSEAARQSYYGREVKDEVDPPTLLGDIAPTILVEDTTGVEKMLSFTGHGNKYLLIDFWASWCQPCHKEIPNLKRIYENFHARGLDIIGISADHDSQEWLDCMEEIQEPWDNYLDSKRQAINEYKVQYIPSIFILDSEGKVVAEKLRGKELYDKVESLLK